METPLITEASSSGAVDNGGDGDGDGYQRSKPYYRRSDAIAYGTRYQKAAALVDLVSIILSYFLFLSSLFPSLFDAFHGCRL